MQFNGRFAAASPAGGSTDIIQRKVTLPETSIAGPAMAFYRNRFYLAWTGTDQAHSINIQSTADGVTFTGKVTLPATSIAAPALAVYQDRLFLSWTGTDAAHSLNVMSSRDGMSFSNKVTLQEQSAFGPAIAGSAARLTLGWTGTDGRLNVRSSADGRSFGSRVTLDDRSIAGPGMAAQGVLPMYVAFTGTDAEHRLNMLSSCDARTFSGKVVFAETSFTGPSLGFRSNDLWMAWAGVGNRLLNVMANGVRYTAMTETSIATPGIAPDMIAWIGVDAPHYINVARVVIP
jgi:hypothetical protein